MKKSIRVLWLLNHTTLRRFEVKQLQNIGIEEIFLPKSFPYHEGNLSASIDYSLDASLSIPAEEIEILNSQDWYDTPSDEAWRIANKYFDVAFIACFPNQIKAVSRNFSGSIVLRVFGLASSYTYTQALYQEMGTSAFSGLMALGERFWFGTSYEHLADIEGSFLKKRNCFMPIGLESGQSQVVWSGEDKRIFFVCPRIGTFLYFRSVYETFKKNFGDLGYLIGGAQPIKVNDPNVLGFVPKDVHERNMRELRVMFYHSTEPNHIHYHPFEAIRAGMPLVYMAGGMLDRLGGGSLPGRCKSVREARKKIERILKDDWSLINEIRRSQDILLEPMLPENCVDAWQAGFRRVLESLEKTLQSTRPITLRKRRVAVIVPDGYRGGRLLGAKLLAQAILIGGRQSGENIEVVFGHLDDASLYSVEDFSDLPQEISRRPYRWRILDRERAYRAMVFAGHDRQMDYGEYKVPDDYINNFLDCDLWVVVSDSIDKPLLPIRPYILMVYDYLQRYIKVHPSDLYHWFLMAARGAERVFVNTEFTRHDAIQFAGLPERKVRRLPMLVPTFSRSTKLSTASKEKPYFIWTTNLEPQKNHLNACKALFRYYQEFDGKLECRITGVGTEDLLKSGLPHLRPFVELWSANPTLRQRIRIDGELPETVFQNLLDGADFLWHAGKVDNGTFSVIEAASFGVPALSSDYPAMREIDTQFGLNLTWMDPDNPVDMARQLKHMEVHAKKPVSKMQTGDKLASQAIERVAGDYWEAVRECL